MDEYKKQHSESSQSEQMYMDPQLGVFNLLKYKEDRDVYGFDKLCVVQIENSETIFTYMGQEMYFTLISDIIADVRSYVYKKKYNLALHFYMVNESTFALAAGEAVEEEYFLHIIRKLYKKFQFINSGAADIPITNRFAVVLNKDDLIESGLHALACNKNSQNYYIVYEDAFHNKKSSKQELEMISILKYALENDGVIPYYQGIYDNKKKITEKYESLMRIRDADGTVYRPCSFMDIAKKYHMYAQLSRRMIDRVLKDFENLDAEVSVNLSAHDINNKEFREWLYNRIKNMKNTSNFVFEILEDEEFRDIYTLQEFITEVRKYGICIAIDDFGSGYSNLLEIIRIKPDYLKVDGEIIKDIINSDQSHIILETIMHLTDSLNTGLVAEFVENSEIQHKISDMGVDFSQGYYFGVPVPIEELSVREKVKEELGCLKK